SMRWKRSCTAGRYRRDRSREDRPRKHGKHSQARVFEPRKHDSAKTKPWPAGHEHTKTKSDDEKLPTRPPPDSRTPDRRCNPGHRAAAGSSGPQLRLEGTRPPDRHLSGWLGAP